VVGSYLSVEKGCHCWIVQQCGLDTTWKHGQADFPSQLTETQPAEWSEWLAAMLHARNCWRYPISIAGMSLTAGRRTVTTRLRAAGLRNAFQNYNYILSGLGRKCESIATQSVALPMRVSPLPER
jgi:hypothetical protein